MLREELGFIGNIWVRQNYLELAGDKVGGHIHYFDHVSLLAKGSVEVFIDGKDPHKFTAPTFIVIRKNHRHEIVALEDDTSWYCVFATRDIDGSVNDIVNKENDPWFTYGAPDDFWETHDLDFVPTLNDFVESHKETAILDFLNLDTDK
jgi:hypothetical protein